MAQNNNGNQNIQANNQAAHHPIFVVGRCSHCKECFETPEALRSHNDAKHADWIINGVTHECDVCFVIFPDNASLQATELNEVAAAEAAVFGGHNCSEFCWKKEPPDDSKTHRSEVIFVFQPGDEVETHRSEVICVFRPPDEMETHGSEVICWFCLIQTKWCPARGCDHAVECIVGSGSYDVTVCCSYGFFWNCTEEAHHPPVDCGTVAKWIWKNSTESEHMNWLCLGAWTEHGERTGRFYACNRYKVAKQEGMKYDDAEKQGEMHKNSLERWATNQSVKLSQDRKDCINVLRKCLKAIFVMKVLLKTSIIYAQNLVACDVGTSI